MRGQPVLKEFGPESLQLKVAILLYPYVRSWFFRGATLYERDGDRTAPVRFVTSQRVLRRESVTGLLMSRSSSIVPAINCLNCGDVNAGVRIFSPPRLLVQEPRGQQRQGLVMMPRYPVPHLVVGQPRLALRARSIPRSDAPPWPLARTPSIDVVVGVRQIVIMLERPVRLPFPRNEQHLSGPEPPVSVRACTRHLTASTISGPFSPSRTSTSSNSLPAAPRTSDPRA